jgi:hypothetical protein
MQVRADQATMRQRHSPIWGFIAGFVSFCALAPLSNAQGPIRVESHQVLVPTVVFDTKLYALTDKKHHNKHSLAYLIAHDPHFWDSIAVRGLVAADFHLLEDGQEQKILSVAFEAPAFAIVADNLGRHAETIGSGGGRWTYPDLDDTDHGVWLPWPQYVIAYVPSPSPADSCHKIQVNMGRRNLAVWSRAEYCNTPHPSSDPLNGTEFGKKMEGELISTAPGKMDLNLQAVCLYGQAGEARVNIQLKFPWRSLRREFKNGILYASIGAEGAVYNKDGSVALRFSDFACCDYGNSGQAPSDAPASENSATRNTSMIPDGYKTQLDLAPGEYDLRVVVSDGEKFGREQIPLTVKNYQEKIPAMSAIALCRRIRKVPADSAQAPSSLPGNYVPLISRGVEYIPSANDSFRQYEMLYAFFEIYDPAPAGQAATQLKAHLIIADAKTGDVTIDFALVDAGPYIKPNASVYRVGRGIDIRTLPPGLYQLEAQATDSMGRSTPWQKATFLVEAGLLSPLPSPNDRDR